MKDIKQIKINEIFSVDDKLYLISKPKTAIQESNEHRQIVFALIRI